MLKQGIRGFGFKPPVRCDAFKRIVPKVEQEMPRGLAPCRRDFAVAALAKIPALIVGRSETTPRAVKKTNDALVRQDQTAEIERG
jgi:hypothetical protein